MKNIKEYKEFLKESILKFTDDEEFDTSCKLHTEERNDGWYVIGDGHLIPVSSEEEGEEEIERLKGLSENLNENISQNESEELIRKWNKYMDLVEIIDGILSEQGELPGSYWQSNVESDLDQLTSTKNVNPYYIKDNYELIKKNFEEIMDGLEGWQINNDIGKFGSLRGINKNLFK